MRKNWYKFLIVAIVVLIVVVVIVVKQGRTRKNAAPAPVAVSATVREERTTPAAETLSPAVPESTPASTEKENPATGDVLALVNGFAITREYLTKMFNLLPAQYQDVYKNDLEGFLEQLITRELLYQEAVSKGFASNNPDATDPEQKKDMAIERLLKDLSAKIVVPEDEIRRFYEERKSEMRGATYEQVKNDITNYLAEQKQGEVIVAHIESLKAQARIKRNEKWLAAERAKRPPDPLEKALKNGKPTVLDLGAGYCVPCKMMKPIFEELQREYGDRANIILLEISEHRQIANRYNVRIIPTQIFFDKQGNIFYRHEGFMSREEILNKLREMGMEE
ncbi:MAG: thioredoxin domain-containing protein [candidate division WOR-3 bacterium]